MVQADIPARSIPPWLAGVVQGLELDRPSVVSVDDIARLLPHSRSTVRTAISALVDRGWLRPVGTRGYYEFIPGATAGPYPSGDPWLVLRAALPGHPVLHVGATSAAYLLGYAQRIPDRHVVVALSAMAVPAAVRSTYEVHRTSPAPASSSREGLPVPTPPELVAEIAQLAPNLRLDAAAGWLRRLLAAVAPSDLAGVLRDRGPATRARAGYLAAALGDPAHAAAAASLGSVGRGPYYTGPRDSTAPFDPRWRVYDSGRIVQ